MAKTSLRMRAVSFRAFAARPHKASTKMIAQITKASSQLDSCACNYKELEQKSMVHHRKYPLLTYNLYLGVKVTQNVAQYLQHNMTYAPVKFKVAMAYG